MVELVAALVFVLAVVVPSDGLFRFCVLALLLVIAFQLHDLAKRPPPS